VHITADLSDLGHVTNTIKSRRRRRRISAMCINSLIPTLPRIFLEKLIVQILSASYEILRFVTIFANPATEPYIEPDVFPFIMVSDPSFMDLRVNVSIGRR
jgi:hypothetical protein